MGHHRDDLLETRLLRLIRGTGGQGLVAMKDWNAPFFRPLLETSKKQLREYLAFRELEFIEDPTNQMTDPLRNWLREEGFQLLLKNNQLTDDGLSRVYYLSLGTRDQLRLLAQYVLQQNLRDISQSQLREIQKRLDNSQNEYTFNVGHILWVVNAQHVKVQ